MKGGSRGLLQYVLKGNRVALVTSWIAGLIAAACALVPPREIGRLTHRFINGPSVTMSDVTWAVMLMLVSQIAFGGLNYWRKYVELKMQASVVRRLTLDTYARVLRFSADFFRDREVEKINSRVLDDAAASGRVLVSASMVVPSSIASMVIICAVMLSYNWFLGVCMIPLALLSRYFILFDAKVKALTRQGREVWDTIRAQGNELVTVTPELRGHYAFDYGLRAISKSFEGYQRAMEDMGKMQALFQAISPLVAAVQTVSLYWLGAALCIAASGMTGLGGEMNWGRVIEFMLLVNLFQRPSQELGLFLIDWQLSQENIRRIGEYLDRPTVFDAEVGSPEFPASADIRFDRVSVTSATGANILNGVDIQVQPGKHVAFCGPAGSGKSTAIALVIRAVEPSGGRLLLSDRAVEEYDVLRTAQNVAFVAQKPLLIDASIRQNILLGLRRPVESLVSDAEGPLDVALLPDVTDISGIDQHLQQVIKLVGLELDVFRKALDCPAPADLKETKTLRNCIGELRAAAAKEFSVNGNTDIVAFNRQSWFPGTIGDNLLGPGGACGPEEAARVLAGLKGQPVLEDLIRMGRRRLRSERLLAAKVAHQAPALLALLPNYSKISQTTEDLDAHDSGVALLDDSTRRILLEVALLADAAGPQGTIDAKFQQSLIEGRQRLAQNDARCCETWNLLNSGEMWETLTLRENLLGGRVDSRIHGAADRVDVILRKVLEEKNVLSAVLLLGLEYRVGEGGKFLSGGQKQKVTIARAILKNPGILLMDEATASLDEASQARVVELLRNHFAGKTVISISHRLSTIRNYDQIVVLDRGQVAQAGTYENLVATDGIFRDLVHQEQGGTPKPVAPALRKSDGQAVTGGDGLSDLQHQLAMSDLFSNMPSEQLEFLARATKVYDFPKSQVIFHRGDPGSELFIVTAGSVTFTIEIPGGKEGQPPQEKIVAVFGIGRVFGELALFGDGLRTLTARAEAGTRLISLQREDLFRLMQADSSIAVNLLRMLGRRMVEVTDERYGVSPVTQG